MSSSLKPLAAIASELTPAIIPLSPRDKKCSLVGLKRVSNPPLHCSLQKAVWLPPTRIQQSAETNSCSASASSPLHADIAASTPLTLALLFKPLHSGHLVGLCLLYASIHELSSKFAAEFLPFPEFNGLAARGVFLVVPSFITDVLAVCLSTTNRSCELAEEKQSSSPTLKGVPSGSTLKGVPLGT